jgi:hypothetical protein
MSENAMLARLDAEIEELEREAFPDQVPPKKEEEKEVDEPLTDDQEVIAEDEVVDPDLEPEGDDKEEVEDLSDKELEAEDLDEGSEEELEEEEKKPKRKSWKAEYEKLDIRYRNLRSATDQDKFTSRTKVAALLETIDGLEGQVTDLTNQLAAVNANTDIYADIFTEEDVDVLGEDAIKAFKKANARSIEAAIAPLKAQLDRTKEQSIKARKGEAEIERQQAYGLFLSGLERLVPDYNELNYDNGFKQYMKKSAQGSNKTREEELADAVSVGNVRWAATFFNDYKTLRTAPSRKLDEKVMPKSNNSSTIDTSVDKKKKTYSIREYETFMDNLTRGKYNINAKQRKLGEELEAMYDRAWAEGRVV